MLPLHFPLSHLKAGHRDTHGTIAAVMIMVVMITDIILEVMIMIAGNIHEVNMVVVNIQEADMRIITASLQDMMILTVNMPVAIILRDLSAKLGALCVEIAG